MTPKTDSVAVLREIERELRDPSVRIEEGDVRAIWRRNLADKLAVAIYLHPAPPVADAVTEEMVRKALRRSYSLGQTYWQQADSQSYSQNRKADETQAKFDALVAETCAALQERAHA